LNKGPFVEEGRAIRNDLLFVLAIVQITQVGLQQISPKNIACAACHTQLLYPFDLAPCDFYLFHTVKAKFEGIQVADQDQFFQRLHRILRGIDQEKLNSVFQAWARQVQEVR
jgi:hypothetical protein